MNERVETGAERAWREFKDEVRGLTAEKIDLVEIERRTQERLNALGAELVAEVMKKADTTSPEVVIAGERWGSRRMSRAIYATMFGPVEVERSIYQQAGRGKVAVAMDLRLGVVEGAYTPRMARILTHATALMPDQDASEFLKAVGTAVTSKSTLSRVPRAMAARYEQRRELVESCIRAQDTIPEQAVTVQVALDGVMVPQDGQHTRQRGRKSEDPDPPRHEQRYGPSPSDAPADHDDQGGRAWHEASVGTLAFFDAEGIRLHTIYLARMPEACKSGLAASLEQELAAVLREQPSMNVVYASDGAKSQWTTLQGIARRVPSNFTGLTMSLVDAFHVAEYIQEAAEAIFGAESSEARIWAATWRETVKEADGAPRVLRSMRARIAQVTSPARRKQLKAAIAYIATQNAAGRMQYADAIQHHFPIGTGITEAAAKTIVATRMKRAGARFSQHGGQTVMTFRAALLSGRFEALHRELGATYQSPVRQAA